MGPLLPCNVVIRRGPDDSTTVVQTIDVQTADVQTAVVQTAVVQTIDAQTMVQLSAAPAVSEVAADADQRLLAALKELETA